MTTAFDTDRLNALIAEQFGPSVKVLRKPDETHDTVWLHAFCGPCGMTLYDGTENGYH